VSQHRVDVKMKWQVFQELQEIASLLAQSNRTVYKSDNFQAMPHAEITPSHKMEYDLG
jgi:hypothetical protein